MLHLIKLHDDIIRVILHVSKHNYARILLLYGIIFTIESRHYKTEIHLINQSIYTGESIGTSLGGGDVINKTTTHTIIHFPYTPFDNRF